MGYLGNNSTLTGTQNQKHLSSTATADQTDFTIAGGYGVGSIDVYRNGVKLNGGNDYTATNGSTVILTQGASADDTLEFVVFENFLVADAITSDGDATINGTVTATAFSGDGSSITGVDADGIAATASVNTSGIITASQFVGPITGAGATVTGQTTLANVNVATGIATVAGQSNLANVSVSAASTFVGEVFLAGGTGELNTSGSQVGIASTASATNVTADGAGIRIVGGTGGDKTILYERDTGCMTFNTPTKFVGLTETLSTATTSVNIAQGAFPNCVLHLDCSNGTVFSYTYAHQNVQIGIVSITNIPADTGVANGVPVTLFLKQHASGATLGYGNTWVSAGIETCTVVGYENGSAVTGVTTHVVTGGGTTMPNTATAGVTDIQTFYVTYDGSSNTTNTSYKVYGSSNSNFLPPRAYQ